MHQVSAIIPNYNHAKFLDERIQSVLHQTYQVDEIIILDDCSTDNSIEVIEKYRSCPKVKIVLNSKNSGSTFRQWDKGIRLSIGNYIWIAESDDFSSPEFLEHTISALDNKNVVLSFCNSFIVDANSVMKGVVSNSYFSNSVDIFQQSFQMNGVDFLNKYLLHNNVIPNASSVVFKKSSYEQASVFGTKLIRTGDWLAWMKMTTVGDIVYNASCYNYFRVHTQSVTAEKEKQVYKYGLDTRLELLEFLNNNYSLHLIDIIKKNKYYISLDRGERGLRYLREHKLIKALTDIIYASFIPSFKTYFLKKAISSCFRF